MRRLRRSPVLLLTLCLFVFLPRSGRAQSGAELHFCLHGEPKTFNPILVDDEASENVRYLTGGVLIRVNRQTQALEPALAESWQVSRDGRKITFHLRKGLYFSDGSSFSSEDVAYTMKLLMDPQTHSATGDAFRTGERTTIDVQTPSPDVAVISFPTLVAGLERLFDQVAILSSKSPKKEMSVLGPYYVSEYVAGSHVLLRRNPNYWKHDAEGHPLPYIETVRLDIQRNRDIELMRFRRGELQLINRLDAEQFDKLQKDSPGVAKNAGTGLDGEEFWFNQTAATLPDYKKKWFQTTAFRQAVSLAINRADLAKVVFDGYATPAYGPVSPSNHFWFNAALPAPKHDPQAALQILARAGFRFENGSLKDSGGHAVEFTVITNSGNTAREKMATMIQQDLSEVGITLKVVTLDFPSLIERIMRTFDYDACLLGLVNTDLDPNGQLTVWLSSGEDHQWNPNQKTPATPWEAEIDKLMHEQATTPDEKIRKAKFDRVQQIVAEQQPFIYLINKNALSAVSSDLAGAAPVALNPQAFWNIETLRLKPSPAMGASK